MEESIRCFTDMAIGDVVHAWCGVAFMDDGVSDVLNSDGFGEWVLKG